MTTRTYKKIIEQELERVNVDIDLKILCGLGYSDDARRHRMLVQAKRSMERRQAERRRASQGSFMFRAARFMSLF